MDCYMANVLQATERSVAFLTCQTVGLQDIGEVAPDSSVRESARQGHARLLDN